MLGSSLKAQTPTIKTISVQQAKDLPGKIENDWITKWNYFKETYDRELRNGKPEKSPYETTTEYQTRLNNFTNDFNYRKSAALLTLLKQWKNDYPTGPYEISIPIFVSYDPDKEVARFGSSTNPWAWYGRLINRPMELGINIYYREWGGQIALNRNLAQKLDIVNAVNVMVIQFYVTGKFDLAPNEDPELLKYVDMVIQRAIWKIGDIEVWSSGSKTP